MLLYLLNGFSPTGVTALELRLQKTRAKAASRIGKYTRSHSSAVSADTLHRIAAIGADCWYGVIRIINEVWMLALQLAGIAALLFSLLRPGNIGSCVHWVKAGLADLPGGRDGPSPAYRREQRHAALLGGIIIVIIIAAGIFVPNFPASTDSSSGKQEYLTAAKAAAVDYATDISNTLLDMRGTGSLTEEKRLQFCSLIDAQIAADQTILFYDMTGLDDYQDLHAGLRSLCTDDISVLQLIRANIENGAVPSQELQLNYANIRGAYYVWVIEDIALGFTEISIEIAFDA